MRNGTIKIRKVEAGEGFPETEAERLSEEFERDARRYPSRSGS